VQIAPLVRGGGTVDRDQEKDGPGKGRKDSIESTEIGVFGSFPHSVVKILEWAPTQR